MLCVKTDADGRLRQASSPGAGLARRARPTCPPLSRSISLVSIDDSPFSPVHLLSLLRAPGEGSAARSLFGHLCSRVSLSCEGDLRDDGDPSSDELDPSLALDPARKRLACRILTRCQGCPAWVFARSVDQSAEERSSAWCPSESVSKWSRTSWERRGVVRQRLAQTRARRRQAKRGITGRGQWGKSTLLLSSSHQAVDLVEGICLGSVISDELGTRRPTSGTSLHSRRFTTHQHTRPPLAGAAALCMACHIQLPSGHEPVM